MTRHAADERAALADLLLAAGPDAPTLCEGWTTRDLAAHLVVRERRPDAAAALVIPALREHGERVRAAVATRPFAEVVEQVRRPPWWSPVRNPILDEPVNGVEFFVHHEDVRRGRPGWEPRDLPAAYEADLFKRIPMLARLGLRKLGVPVLVVAPGFGEVAVGSGEPVVRLTGAPAELLLFLSGRQRAARVEVDGPPAVAGRMRGAHLGM